MRTTLAYRLRRVPLQLRPDRRYVAGDHHRIDVAQGNISEFRQQLARRAPAYRVVRAVLQRGQPEELVGSTGRGVQRTTDRLAVREAGVLRDEVDVMREPRPTGESVAARDHQLGVGQAADGVELGGERFGRGIGGPDLPEQGLGLLLQVFEARRTGELTGRHRDLLSTCRCPRRRARKEVDLHRTTSRPGGLSPSRGPVAPWVPEADPTPGPAQVFSIHHSVNSCARPSRSSRITHRLLNSLGGSVRYVVQPRTKPTPSPKPRIWYSKRVSPGASATSSQAFTIASRPSTGSSSGRR